MPCHRPSVKIAGRPSLPGPAAAIFAAPLVLALCGCEGPVSIDPVQRRDPIDALQRSSANDKPRHSSDDETPGAPSRLLAMLLAAMTETHHPTGKTGRSFAQKFAFRKGPRRAGFTPERRHQAQICVINMR
jgi:hypothetical protein